MEGNSNLKWNEHSAVLLSKLHNFLERKSFVDITLATDEGLSIQVHRVILCAASPYFQDLLSQHLEDAHITIILSDISFDHLTALVEFIYKGKVSVPCCQLPALLETASSLKIKGLADAIKDDQQQHDQTETHQPENDSTLLRIVSIQSIGKMLSQPDDEPKIWEDNEVVKKEANYDSDATVIYEPEEYDGIFGDESPDLVNELQPAPLLMLTSSTDSTGRRSDHSSNKRKKSHQQHPSSSKAGFRTHTATSNRKSSVEDEEGSSRKRSLNTVSVKRQEKEPQHQIALDFTVLGDGTPPAPIVFKREKELEEQSHKDILSEELAESDSDDEDATSHYSSSENVFTGSSDEEYGIASTSTAKPKTKATKSTRKAIITERKQQVPSPPVTVPKGPFKCEECGRIYKHRKSLNTHLKYECRKEASFCCTLCKYRTGTKWHFKRHLIGFHKIKDTQLVTHGLGQIVRPEMPFKCDKCPRSYKSKDSLQRHRKNECSVDPRFNAAIAITEQSRNATSENI